MYGVVHINIEDIQRRSAFLQLARCLTVAALVRTTRASTTRRQWKWACRAVPGFFVRALRREMERLILDIRQWRV